VRCERINALLGVPIHLVKIPHGAMVGKVVFKNITRSGGGETLVGLGGEGASVGDRYDYHFDTWVEKEEGVRIGESLVNLRTEYEATGHVPMQRTDEKILNARLHIMRRPVPDGVNKS
jgi:hypothetical protein